MTTQQTPPHAAAADIPFTLPQVSTNDKRRARRLLAALQHHYPDAACSLTYTSPHELLIATILSAQCTDVAVNKATPALFQKFPNPAHYAASSPTQIEPYVHSLGFFRNKSKAVHSAMTNVVERFNGQVPRTMDELLSLHGVARKTANVVLGNAFAVNVGFVVDTHVQRLARRLCLIDDGQSVQMIERKLMALFPRQHWTALSHMLIHHGRNACSARTKNCADHPICKGFGRCCERPRTHRP